MPEHPDPQGAAEEVRRHFGVHDRVARRLGISLDSVSPGRATLTMAVTDDMLNAYDICHGGVLVTLADTAFALACNSHGKLTVAAGLTMDFVAAVRSGDLITACAIEVALARRTGIYDVTLTNQKQRVVATFRGRSARIESSSHPAQAGATGGTSHPA